MKLIDILVGSGDGMSLFGVHTKYLAMDPDGRVYGYSEMPSPTAIGWGVPDALYTTDGRGCLIQIDRDDVDGRWQSAIITLEQYEAALAAKNDGWIEWDGGECPVADFLKVEYQLRGGAKGSESAKILEWQHEGGGHDIIAYRLHKQKEAEQDKANLNECIDHDAAPVWSGEGLPPVGCFCEVEDLDGMLVYGQGESGEVIAHVENTAVIRMSYGLGCFKARFLRPLRTNAERKRDAAVEIMTQILCSPSQASATAKKIYDAIAAGEIPGVNLED